MGEGKSLIGIVEGDSNPKLFIPQLISYYKEGKFPFDRLIRVFEFDEINEAFEASHSGNRNQSLVKDEIKEVPGMEYQLYINGEWKNTVTGYISQDKNPADDSIFAQVHFAGREEVDEAIASAQKAWKPWADTTADEKERILLKAADWMQEHIDEVAGVLMGESGSAFGKAYFEAGFAVDILRAAAGECRRVFGEVQQQAPGEISMIRRLPLGGFVGGHRAFNFPLASGP